MPGVKKTYLNLLSGRSDANINFHDLQSLLDSLGFECRVNGDHFIYYYGDLPENINIQPKGNKAKPYQVKQIRRFLNRYGIGMEV